MFKFLTATILFTAFGIGLAAAQQSPQAMDSARFIEKQTTGEVATNDLVGAVVYDAKDMKIGEVNDLIMDSSGSVQAAVIGVGGFLGIGEKNVAVKFSELQSRLEDDGDIRITFTATKEELQTAPTYAFVRDRDQPSTGSIRQDSEPVSPAPAPK